MDISFQSENEKFNYRVCAVILNDGKILAMQDERSPYFYLPGGRVKMGETAEDAVIRETKEELNIVARITRPLWLNQGFFKENVDGLQYHEICIYFLMDISDTDLLSRGDAFFRQEGVHRHTFQWLKYEQLQHEYFYPVFLKKQIFDLPQTFMIQTNMNERRRRLILRLYGCDALNLRLSFHDRRFFFFVAAYARVHSGDLLCQRLLTHDRC